jgi:hypothetical protein
MTTVLEEYATEKQRSVVCFCRLKDLMQRIFIKKCFLFTVGSVCRVKRFTTGCLKFSWWRRGWNGGAEMAETSQKSSMLRVSTQWQSYGTSVSMLTEDMSRNKCFFPQSSNIIILRFISIFDLCTDSPSHNDSYFVKKLIYYAKLCRALYTAEIYWNKNFNIILPYRPRLSKGSLSFRFSNFVCMLPVSLAWFNALPISWFLALSS